jgi:DNA relaxase NicK
MRPDNKGWSAGVDAATLVGLDHRSALQFYNEYETLSLDVEVAASREKPWGTHGYKGKQRGPVRVGLKGDRTIISVTGPLSFRILTLSTLVASRFTRIDLQITCEMDTPWVNHAYELYQVENLQNMVERGKLHMSYHSSPEGDTVYINKRTSPNYARIYDKSQNYGYIKGKIWRYEIEIKEELADKIGSILAVSDSPETLAADYVASWFADRHICVPIEQRNRFNVPKTATSVTGIDTTLEWLSRQVKPSLEWLNQAGLKGKAEDALGVQLRFREEPEERIDF